MQLGALAGKTASATLMPVSFAQGTMDVTFRACRFDHIADVDADVIAAGRNQGIAPGANPLCPIVLGDSLGIPTSVQRLDRTIELPDVGVYLLQMGVTDAYTEGVATKGEWLVVRETPVVTLHGFGAVGQVWGSLANRLYEVGYLPEREGGKPFFVKYGWDDAPVSFLRTWGPVASYWPDVVATVAETRRTTGISNVDLVAHSMGGTLARYYDNFALSGSVRKMPTDRSRPHRKPRPDPEGG